MSEVVKEDLTVGEALSWWSKNKQLVWGVVVLLVGLFGGNADRISSLLPTMASTEVIAKIEARLDALETKVFQQVPPKPPVVVEGSVIRDYNN